MERRWLHAAVMLLALLSLPAAAQTLGEYTDVRELPKTPAAERASKLIELVNAGDPAKLRSYLQEAAAPPLLEEATLEELVAVSMETHANFSPLRFHSVRSYKNRPPSDDLVVIVRSAVTDGWLGLILRTEPRPPHRLTNLAINPARVPSDLPAPGQLRPESLVPELGAYMDRIAAAGVFSGSVLLAKDGKVIYEKAYGLASRAYKAPNTVETKFNLGSMNKMFTAVAIAQLVERGKLSYEDRLSKFVDESWLPKTVTEKIQIKHLLTHSSGLGSYFNETYDRSSRMLFRALDDYKPLVAGETLAFEPGTESRYSNTGFLLLGVVIEKISGKSYFDYIRQNVTGPAGMTSTDAFEMDIDTENLAMGYSKEYSSAGIVYRNNLYQHVIKGGPAGGGFSTVGDLLRFDQALRAGKLVGGKTLQTLFTPRPELDSPGYGYGFMIAGSPEDRIVGHGGGFPGISAKLDMYLDSGYTVAVLANYGGGVAEMVSSKARELIGRVQASQARGGQRTAGSGSVRD